MSWLGAQEEKPNFLKGHILDDSFNASFRYGRSPLVAMLDLPANMIPGFIPHSQSWFRMSLADFDRRGQL